MKNILLTFIIIVCGLNIVRAELNIGTVARIKGQETNELHGFGLVVGLKGTGDNTKEFVETARSLAQMMQLFGHTQMKLEELAKVRNAALVAVTVTVPGVGAREGDLLDCKVASTGKATSLEGGQLMVTSLLGPMPAKTPADAHVFGTASGSIVIEDRAIPTVGRISRGCRLEDDFFNPYVKDGIITLVLDQRFAGWEMASAVAAAVNQETPDGVPIAEAINQNTVLVKLPEYENAVQFIADIMQREPIVTSRIPTVVINERAGIVTVDEDVEITPTTVTHGMMTINLTPVPVPVAAGDNAATLPPAPRKPERFVGIDTVATRTRVENPRLKALTEALNEVNTPSKEIIGIIKALDAQGNLHGRIKYQ